MALPPQIQQAEESVKKAFDVAKPYLKTLLHWGYIPAIIAGGMLLTEPRPSWVQLLGPM